MKTNTTPHTPIIHQHYSTVKVVQPPKKVLIEEEICKRLDGCPIVNNVCVDCLTCEELVGVTWRVSDCEELVGYLMVSD